MQEISDSSACTLEFNDLTAWCGISRDQQVKRLIEQHILEPVDVSIGPLFAPRLLKLSNDEHVLILAMEHIISDGISSNILLRDLMLAYRHVMSSRLISLPALPVQFADYAVWQLNARRSWLEKHGRYWGTHLEGCKRLQFPRDYSKGQSGDRLGWGAVPLYIASSCKKELREWCRTQRTTLVMSMFTAYVALVMRWCNVSEAVVRYQTDGRSSPQVETAIGYFASPLYLRIELHCDDNLIDVLNKITAEYCNALEHADFGYVEAQVPTPEFTGTTAFNWLPQAPALDRRDVDLSQYEVTCSPVFFEHPMLAGHEKDSEPVVLLLDTDDEINGHVYFPREKFGTDGMERFGKNFLGFVQVLLREPKTRLTDIALM